MTALAREHGRRRAHRERPRIRPGTTVVSRLNPVACDVGRVRLGAPVHREGERGLVRRKGQRVRRRSDRVDHRPGVVCCRGNLDVARGVLGDCAERVDALPARRKRPRGRGRVHAPVGPGGAGVDTTTTSGTFSASGQGVYAFRSIARDAAGNVEVPPSANDTWTMVDTIAPASHTLPLPTYEASLGFTVYWGPQFDSPDIASYRIQSRDNGGAWTEAATFPVGTTSAAFTGQDGHTYEFRSMATDRAGNPEAPPSGNDSWTIVDVTPPDSRVTNLPAYE